MALKIFVSVGTHPQQFDRLLRELDVLLEMGKLKATIFAQTGNSSYKPKLFGSKKFLGEQAYNKSIADSELIISHGGAGTIINALRRGKKLIVVPRLERFGEHTNDHQMDLAKALESQGKCLAVYDMVKLGQTIQKAKAFKPSIASNREKLVSRIKSFLKD